MTFITWTCLRCVQELATILGPQNPTQRSCVSHIYSHSSSLYPCFTICCPRTDAARRWKVAGIKLRAGGLFREFRRRDLTDIDTFISRDSEVG